MRGSNILFYLILCSLLTISCMKQKDHGVSVQGAISHLGSSALYVSYTNATYKRTVDTIHSTMGGKFNFKLQTSKALTPISIYFAEKKCWTTLFAEPGDHISIRGNIDYVDLLTIQGGLVNDDLNRFKMQIRALYKERLDLLKGSYSRENSSEVRLAEINLLLKRAAKEFIKENPSAIASVVLIQDFFYQDYDTTTGDLLALLETPASTSPLADKLREGIRKGH